MTKNNPKTAPCTVCGKNKTLVLYKKNRMCEHCRDLAKQLKANSAHLKLLSKIALGDNSCRHQTATVPGTGSKELPEVLDAVRYRTKDRENNKWYVSVSELEGEPVEIFASTAFDRDQHLQSRISNLTTITRLISLILRHVFLGEQLTLEKTLVQLRRSSRQRNDLPDMLAGVLSNYSRKPQETEGREFENP